MSDVEELSPALGALVEWANGSGFDTEHCDCGHEGLGPAWHSDACPWPAIAWEGYAVRLAKALDAWQLVDGDAEAFVANIPQGFVSDEEAQAFADNVNRYEGP